MVCLKPKWSFHPSVVNRLNRNPRHWVRNQLYFNTYPSIKYEWIINLPHNKILLKIKMHLFYFILLYKNNNVSWKSPTHSTIPISSETLNQASSPSSPTSGHDQPTLSSDNVFCFRFLRCAFFFFGPWDVNRSSNENEKSK